MTDMGKNVTRITIAALAIVTTVVTVLLAPIVRGNASNAEILQRLARLEECTGRLKDVPETVAEVKAILRIVQEGQRRVEAKLDYHVGKGR